MPVGNMALYRIGLEISTRTDTKTLRQYPDSGCRVSLNQADTCYIHLGERRPFCDVALIMSVDVIASGFLGWAGKLLDLASSVGEPESIESDCKFHAPSIDRQSARRRGRIIDSA